jgi:hypothetical protein
LAFAATCLSFVSLQNHRFLAKLGGVARGIRIVPCLCDAGAPRPEAQANHSIHSHAHATPTLASECDAARDSFVLRKVR